MKCLKSPCDEVEAFFHFHYSVLTEEDKLEFWMNVLQLIRGHINRCKATIRYFVHALLHQFLVIQQFQMILFPSIRIVQIITNMLIYFKKIGGFLSPPISGTPNYLTITQICHLDPQHPPLKIYKYIPFIYMQIYTYVSYFYKWN